MNHSFVPHAGKRNTLRVLAAAALATVALAVSAQDKPLKIGVTAGPHAQIFEQVKKLAEKDGLKIQIVEFSDYIQPNAALAAAASLKPRFFLPSSPRAAASAL